MPHLALPWRVTAPTSATKARRPAPPSRASTPRRGGRLHPGLPRSSPHHTPHPPSRTPALPASSTPALSHRPGSPRRAARLGGLGSVTKAAASPSPSTASTARADELLQSEELHEPVCVALGSSLTHDLRLHGARLLISRFRPCHAAVRAPPEVDVADPPGRETLAHLGWNLALFVGQDARLARLTVAGGAFGELLAHARHATATLVLWPARSVSFVNNHRCLIEGGCSSGERLHVRVLELEGFAREASPPQRSGARPRGPATALEGCPNLTSTCHSNLSSWRTSS